MPRGIPADDETVTAAARAYLDGATCAEVATRYGVGLKRLRRRVADLGGQMRSSGGHRLPEDVRDAIAVAYAEGGSYDSVAATYEISPATVANIIADRRIPPHPTGGTRRRRFTDAEARDLADRHARGESFKAIARDLGCSDHCVARAVARLPRHDEDEPAEGAA